jgi:hypothetical protein
MTADAYHSAQHVTPPYAYVKQYKFRATVSGFKFPNNSNDLNTCGTADAIVQALCQPLTRYGNGILLRSNNSLYGRL